MIAVENEPFDSDLGGCGSVSRVPRVLTFDKMVGESFGDDTVDQRLRAFGGEENDLASASLPGLSQGEHSHDVPGAHLVTGISSNDEGRHGSEEILFFEEFVHQLGSLPILFVIDVLHAVGRQLHQSRTCFENSLVGEPGFFSSEVELPCIMIGWFEILRSCELVLRLEHGDAPLLVEFDSSLDRERESRSGKDEAQRGVVIQLGRRFDEVPRHQTG